MRLVGFISEHDNVIGAKHYKEYLLCQKSHQLQLDKIVNYLKNGVLVFGWMHYTTDVVTNELISPHGYYTDGIWVWPSYLSHYIVKNDNFAFDLEFLRHIDENSFTVNFDVRINIVFFEKALSEVFRGANPKIFENITGIGRLGID